MKTLFSPALRLCCTLGIWGASTGLLPGTVTVSLSASAQNLPVFTPPESVELMGLMLGHVGTTEAKIWVQSDEETEAFITYWPENNIQAARHTSAVALSESRFLAHTFVLEQLQPQQTYRYAVYLNQQKQTEHNLSFRTAAPAQKTPQDLKFLVGSCYYLDDPLMKLFQYSYGAGIEIFETMAKEEANAMMWTGDNVYFAPFDLSSPYNMNQRYKKHRQHQSLKDFLVKMPHYATWDDHDFGPNNSSRRFSGANAATDIFKAYWANPRYGGITEPGIFFSQRWQDVEFIVTDNRTYRDPNNFPDPLTRSFFGSTQMDWLKSKLVGSDATFKVVVIGSPVFNRYYKESFYQAKGEFNTLMQFLEVNKIKGVVFLSGDRHHSELTKMEREGTYPLYNYVNSPLTSQPTKFLSDEETHDSWRVPGSLIRQRNYGRVAVSGAPGQRVLALETVSATGERLWNYSIPAAELGYTAE